MKTKVLICPYCGDTQAAAERCRACGGLFEPLSRQASHNQMGPWYIRDERRPFQPGASYETIVKLVERGQVTRYSVLRGPTTRQFWTIARRVPGIAHLLGYCHNCDATVGKEDHGCPSCGVPFGAYLDRNYLGLPDVKPLPWDAPVEEGTTRVADASALVDFRRAAEPLGLSSFASDDELRGMAARSPYTPSAGIASSSTVAASFLAEDAHVNGGAAPATHSPAAGAPAQPRPRSDDGLESASIRSMQRRLQQQSQQLRLLMALLGIVAIGAAMIIGGMIVRSNRQALPEAAPGIGASQESASPRAQATTNPSTSPVDEAVAAAGDQINPDLDEPAEPAARTIAQEHEQARALLEGAGQQDRPLKARIADADAAVQLLKSIRSRAVASDRPEGLDQQIADAEQLLERLRLEEFFP